MTPARSWPSIAALLGIQEGSALGRAVAQVLPPARLRDLLAEGAASAFAACRPRPWELRRGLDRVHHRPTGPAGCISNTCVTVRQVNAEWHRPVAAPEPND